MKNSNWRERLQNFMQGRYGSDQLSRFLLILTLILLVLNFVSRSSVFGILAGVLLVWVYFRMLSRDVMRRRDENQKYLELKDKVTSFFQNFRIPGTSGKSSGSGQADFRIFRCPKCGQKIRIPRGHGTVEITCPKCRTRFRRRT